jgi:hypothetical protein
MPGRPRQGSEDNFKLYLNGTGQENMGLINFTQDRDKC